MKNNRQIYRMYHEDLQTNLTMFVLFSSLNVIVIIFEQLKNKVLF